LSYPAAFGAGAVLMLVAVALSWRMPRRRALPLQGGPLQGGPLEGGPLGAGPPKRGPSKGDMHESTSVE